MPRRSLRQTPTRIADYEEVTGKRLNATKAMSGTQAGDPVRAGEAMIAVTEMANAPRHLPLGAWGFEAVLKDRRERLAQIEQVQAMSVAAGYPSD